jgi:DNA end-binding protein Ku
MPRSIWTGAISFGLVNVPVKLYSAVSKKTVRFHQLHEDTGVRIQQRRVDPSTGEEVAYEHIVKGFEIAPDRYVVLTPDEIEALDPAKTRTIDIEDFVEIEEIDPIFFDHPYYLAPGTGAQKPYRLLLEAMREAGKVAIARVVIRQKEQLVAIRPMGDVLAMATMNYADEIVPPDTLDELPDDSVAINDRELKMAQQLIESLSGDFDPAKYKDEYRDQVLALIERKANGEEITVQPQAEEPAKVPDLMAALEASLAAVQERAPGPDGNGGGAKKRKAPAKATGKSSTEKSSGGTKAAGGSRKKPAAKKG